MADKLQQDDRFPTVTLKLVSGGLLTIPNDISTHYAAVIFYRGHW